MGSPTDDDAILRHHHTSHTFILSYNDSVLTKSYINLLVEEVLVKDETATIKGSYAALAYAMHQMKMGATNQVPTFIHD